jgi:hypothetical protein
MLSSMRRRRVIIGKIKWLGCSRLERKGLDRLWACAESRDRRPLLSQEIKQTAERFAPDGNASLGG